MKLQCNIHKNRPMLGSVYFALGRGVYEIITHEFLDMNILNVRGVYVTEFVSV